MNKEQGQIAGRKHSNIKGGQKCIGKESDFAQDDKISLGTKWFLIHGAVGLRKFLR